MDRERRYANSAHHQDRRRTYGSMVETFRPSDESRQTYRYGMDDGRLESIGYINRDGRSTYVHLRLHLHIHR